MCAAFGREFAINDTSLPGVPDVAFYDGHLAVFVLGCHWKKCPDYIPGKGPLSEVVRYRRRHLNDLEKSGWKVVRIWDCELRKFPWKSRLRIEKVLNES